MPTGTFIGPQPGKIKRILYGTVTIGANLGSGTDTLPSAVNVEKSQLFFLGLTSGSSNTYSSFTRITLTNSTTVTANRTLTDPTYTAVVSYQLTEYY